MFRSDSVNGRCGSRSIDVAAPSPRTLKALMLRPSAWHPMLEVRSGWKAELQISAGQGSRTARAVRENS